MAKWIKSSSVAYHLELPDATQLHLTFDEGACKWLGRLWLDDTRNHLLFRDGYEFNEINAAQKRAIALACQHIQHERDYWDRQLCYMRSDPNAYM